MKSFFRFIFYMILVFILLSGVIDLLNESKSDQPVCEDVFTVINANNDRMHQREWETKFAKAFCTSYYSEENESLRAGRARNEIIYDIEDYENFWGKVYRRLVAESRENLDFLADSLVSISKEKKLSSSQLAELVVTFVQDIPYSYVRVEECSTVDNKGKACIGNVALGLLSPYEFVHSLFGDCDTRAVLIYTLLEKMGYDPMIVISNEYAHAMIALNIPAAGDHLKYRGKNYYFWETTGKGWPIGILPPNSNNVNYWKIALVNEL
ncbi:hypothetical protein [Ekhidna sp.]|uniref:hypothetical protein n=2 Tax=Ekhidna sp. TaxID=2608089 RepID=UPI003299F04D